MAESPLSARMKELVFVLLATGATGLVPSSGLHGSGLRLKRLRALESVASTPGGKSRLVQRPRRVSRVDRGPRLPVWPSFPNGIACVVLDLLGFKEAAAWLEDKIGGRVCPMMLDDFDADPFLLLVHHRHSFLPFDPFRAIFRAVLAEGFPAHPHRGFETITCK